MSHFCVAVFTEEGQDMDELLAPFFVEQDVALHLWMTKKEVIQRVRKQIEDMDNCYYKKYLKSPERFANIHQHDQELLHFLKEEFEEQLHWSDEQCYQYGVEYFGPEEIDENENFLTTYNTQAKWDRYEVGGGWENLLPVMQEGKMQYRDSAKVSEIIFPENFNTFAVLFPDGTWIEMGEVLFCGMVKDGDLSWSQTYKERIIDKADPEWTLTIVDCHI